MEHRLKPCQCDEAQNQKYQKNFIFDDFYFQHATNLIRETTIRSICIVTACNLSINCKLKSKPTFLQ